MIGNYLVFLIITILICFNEFLNASTTMKTTSTKKTTTRKVLTDSNNMKIIRPNHIKIDKFNSTSLEVLPLKAFSEMLKFDAKFFQFIDTEVKYKKLIKCEMHPFVQMIHLAYSYHLPIVITPDIIWYLISSAAAIHINLHAEELRYKFANHTDKVEIKVKRDDFVLNSWNPWNEAIDEFAFKLFDVTNNNITNLITNNFTTTTEYSKIVSQIVLMDAMKQYFAFVFETMCGIPEIRVMGNKQDWVNVRARTRSLIKLMPKINNWLISLEEILANFISLYGGKVNGTFWNEIYKQAGGSGGPYISGWVIALFPYLEDYKENIFIFNQNLTWRNAGSDYWGLKTKSFPYHMNQVNFLWKYFQNEINMLFVGGLVGLSKTADQALTPVFGYGVALNLINR